MRVPSGTGTLAARKRWSSKTVGDQHDVDLNKRLRRWSYLSQLDLPTVAHPTREWMLPNGG